MQQGTKRRALLVFLVIAFVVALVATYWPNHRERTQIETYLRQGLRQGAVLLKRDIDRLSPEGQDPGPAVQHLGALGLGCAAPATTTGEWSCVMRRPGDNRMMITIEAAVRVERGLVTETLARISESPR
ncbi:hypothetical protein EJV46_03380 [Roseococcus sp. SYP-B2431]|uniref:hypothetical protein n=1 Tax=Roseococcus sp. SYP-B2431 TaxID=2496640 RepID=UPI00103E28E3|nr:hypothetical protein [Roseococcus sp. SYP-B2431]TCH99728.1 hypothetical protein EJV46_03380 [Roseococcus sp. SYP-B2431]